MKKIFWFLFCSLYLQNSYAALKIDITQATEGMLPIAVIPFANPANISVDLAQLITYDLNLSGNFSVLKRQNLPALPSHIQQVRYPQWQGLGINHIVIGQVQLQRANSYQVSFYLLDVFSKEQLIAFNFNTSRKKLRQVAHKISDKIYQALTGERGAFNTRIAYVTQSPRGYALHLADIDGANKQTILNSPEPLLSPAWSPDAKRLAYVSLERKNTHIYIQNLQTGKRKQVAAWKGLNTAPAWSPDGRSLAFSNSKTGNLEIYILNLQTRQLRQLTHNRAIDTEPTWSPDGATIIFTSSRGGSAQLYKIASSGGKAERLSFQGKYNAKASFSADGKTLVCLHNGGHGYQIGLMDLDEHSLSTRILTKTKQDESPSFSPNGRMVIYATPSGLVTISVDGRVRQPLATGKNTKAQEPAWSPFLGEY